jgi:tRNA 2-thiouridine synthesizing protein A
MADQKIDAKGLQCPGPIVATFKAMKEMQAGDGLTVEATDRGFIKDIEAWCHKTGNKLLSLEDANDVITAKIEKV